MKQLRQWPFIGVILALMLLSGSWAFAVSSVATIALYVVLLSARRIADTSFFAVIFGLTAAVGCAVLVAAVQLLPYLDYRTWTGETFPPFDSVESFLPIWLPVFPAAMTDQSEADTIAAFGVIFAIPAAFLWVAIRESAPANYIKRVDTLMVAAWFCWLLSWAALFVSPRYGIGTQQLNGISIPPTFLLLLTVGIVGDAWEQLSRTDKRERLLIRGRWSMFTSLGLIAIGLVLVRVNEGDGISIWALVIYMLGSLTYVGAIIALGKFSKPRLLPYALAAIVGLTLLLHGHPGGRWQKPDTLSPWAPTLHNEGVTIVGGNRAIRNLPLMAARVRTPYGIFSRPSPDYAALLEAADSRPESLNAALGIQSLWLNQHDLQQEFLILRPSLKLQNAMPGDSALFHSLREEQGIRVLDIDSGQSVPIAIRRSDRKNGWIYIEVEVAQLGLLVVPDSHHPGWTARLNGRVTPAGKSGPFLAMTLPTAGRHTIEFRYREPSFDRGLIFSVVGLLLVLGGLIHFAYRSWHTSQ